MSIRLPSRRVVWYPTTTVVGLLTTLWFSSTQLPCSDCKRQTRYADSTAAVRYSHGRVKHHLCCPYATFHWARWLQKVLGSLYRTVSTTASSCEVLRADKDDHIIDLVSGIRSAVVQLYEGFSETSIENVTFLGSGFIYDKQDADIAVIRLTSETIDSFPAVEFDIIESPPQQGQSVIAYGATQYGDEPIATLGHVSQPQQSFKELKVGLKCRLIQIAMTTIPGFSGSPVFSINGKVIAMIIKKFEEYALAIPVAQLAVVVSSIEERGDWSMPYIGLKLRTPVEKLYDASFSRVGSKSEYRRNSRASVDVSSSFSGVRKDSEHYRSNIPSNGVIVDEVKPGSPGEKAGIRQNDRITHVNGTLVTSHHQLTQLCCFNRFNHSGVHEMELIQSMATFHPKTRLKRFFIPPQSPSTSASLLTSCFPGHPVVQSHQHLEFIHDTFRPPVTGAPHGTSTVSQPLLSPKDPLLQSSVPTLDGITLESRYHYQPPEQLPLQQIQQSVNHQNREQWNLGLTQIISYPEYKNDHHQWNWLSEKRAPNYQKYSASAFLEGPSVQSSPPEQHFSFGSRWGFSSFLERLYLPDPLLVDHFRDVDLSLFPSTKDQNEDEANIEFHLPPTVILGLNEDTSRILSLLDQETDFERLLDAKAKRKEDLDAGIFTSLPNATQQSSDIFTNNEIHLLGSLDSVTERKWENKLKNEVHVLRETNQNAVPHGTNRTLSTCSSIDALWVSLFRSANFLTHVSVLPWSQLEKLSGPFDALQSALRSALDGPRNESCLRGNVGEAISHDEVIGEIHRFHSSEGFLPPTSTSICPFTGDLALPPLLTSIQCNEHLNVDSPRSGGMEDNLIKVEKTFVPVAISLEDSDECAPELISLGFMRHRSITRASSKSNEIIQGGKSTQNPEHASKPIETPFFSSQRYHSLTTRGRNSFTTSQSIINEYWPQDLFTQTQANAKDNLSDNKHFNVDSIFCSEACQQRLQQQRQQARNLSVYCDKLKTSSQCNTIVCGSLSSSNVESLSLDRCRNALLISNRRKPSIKALRRRVERIAQRSGAHELGKILRMFSRRSIAFMTYEQLADFEKILEMNNLRLFGVVSGQYRIPEELMYNKALPLLLMFVNPKHPNLLPRIPISVSFFNRLPVKNQPVAHQCGK